MTVFIKHDTNRSGFPSSWFLNISEEMDISEWEITLEIQVNILISFSHKGLKDNLSKVWRLTKLCALKIHMQCWLWASNT